MCRGGGGERKRECVFEREWCIYTRRLFECGVHLFLYTCRIPVIGGKELNLHVLYAEVTKRGGFDKVVEYK